MSDEQWSYSLSPQIRPGPSVVTPPAQDEQPDETAVEHLTRTGHKVVMAFAGPSWHCEQQGCPDVGRTLMGTGRIVEAVPAAPSVSTDHTDEKHPVREAIQRLIDDPPPHRDRLAGYVPEVTDHTDEKLKAELLSLCVPVQFSNGYPIEAIPKASLLSFFAIRALGAGRG